MRCLRPLRAGGLFSAALEPAVGHRAAPSQLTRLAFGRVARVGRGAGRAVGAVRREVAVTGRRTLAARALAVRLQAGVGPLGRRSRMLALCLLAALPLLVRMCHVDLLVAAAVVNGATRVPATQSSALLRLHLRTQPLFLLAQLRRERLAEVVGL